MRILLILILSLGTAGAAQVTLVWNASTTPGVQYRIKWGFASGQVNQTHVVETGFMLTTTIVEPWAPGTTVYFTAYAWNEGGESGPSNEVSYTVPLVQPTPTPVPTPEPPTNLQRVLEAVWNWLNRWRS